MAGSESDAVAPGEVMYCVNHPKTETLIRCSKCLDPICPKCAVRTPVGLRCPKCANATRSPIYKVSPAQVALAAAVAVLVGSLAGMIAGQLGLFFTFFLSAPIGGLVAEAVVRALHGKRGRILQAIAVLGIVLGVMLGPWLWLALIQGSLSVLPSNPLAYLSSLLNLSRIAYIVLASGAAIARLR